MTYTDLTYKCPITGQEYDYAGGYYGSPYSDVTVSEEGVEYLIEQYIQRRAQGERYPKSIPFFVYTLYQRFLQRVKRNNHIPHKLRQELLIKYKHCCANCGSTQKLEVDHIIPVSKGGKSDYKNLQILCKKCNIKKSDKIQMP